MNELIILILIFFVLDNFFTYFNAVRYKKLFPDKKESTIELNPLAGFLWDKLGLLFGGLIMLLISGLFVAFIIFYMNDNVKYMMLGAYFIVTLIHIDNSTRISNQLNREKKRKVNWDILILILLLGLSIIDMILTHSYISKYHEWRPDVTFRQMENNPLLVFLMNHIGVNYGMLLGSLIIFGLIYVVGIKASMVIRVILLLALCLTLYINLTNIHALNELIKLYPLGYV